MAWPRRYIREDIDEEDLWIDLSILTFLREEMLLGNLDYVSLREPYKQGLFSSDINCSWERFRRRALYQVWMGFAEPRIVYGANGEHIDSKKHTWHLCSLRITPFGFMQIAELEKEVKKYEWFNRYITQLKKMSDRIMGMKGGIIFTLTSLLIVFIFVFDVKVSAIVRKIPILSSVIDTKMLEEFEAINEQDEFYQAIMKDADGEEYKSEPDTAPNTTSGKVLSPDVLPSAMPFKDAPVPKAIKNLLPAKAKIENMAVRNISATEKLFRVTLDNGMVRYIQVRKEGGKYVISGE